MPTIIKPMLLAGCVLLAGASLHAHQPGFGIKAPVKGGAVAGGASLTMPAKVSSSSAPARIGERNPLKPPFCETFDDYPEGMEHDNFNRNFETINSDGDKNPTSGSDRTWGFYNYSGETNGRLYSKCAYLQYPLEVNACDDWLIPRAISLEAGKYYRVTMDVSLYTEGKVHRMEVKMGEYNDAEGMTATVIPPVDVLTTVPTQIEGWFVPEYDGLHYMGIHGISYRALSEGGYLFVDNIGMDAARSGLEPGNVTDITFVSDPDGTPSATISFKAPAVRVDGKALTGTTTVTVKRGNTLLKTFTAKPGENLKLKDTVSDHSTQTYTFTATNSDGAGCDLKVSHFIGMSKPKAPVISAISEPSPGMVRLAWDAPATDVNGTSINPAKLTYNISRVTESGLEEYKSAYSGTDVTVSMGLGQNEQASVMMAVSALINGQESEVSVSDEIFVGAPYTVPVHYAFQENLDADVVMSAYADEGVKWRLLDDFSDPKSQDGDGGYIGMVGTSPDQYGEISTGKIDFSGVSDAFVSFHTYIYADDENQISVSLVDCATGERREVKSYVLNQFPGVGWTRVICPLPDCAGKTMRVILGARIVSHGYVMFDNLVVDRLHDIDLALSNIKYTRYAEAGVPYEVEALVTNIGAKAVPSFEAILYCDGEQVASYTNSILEPEDATEILLRGTFSAISPEMPTFYLEIVADGEGNTSDNVSQEFNITFLAPIHPVVSTLRGEESADGTVALEWSAPDVKSAAPEESLEDFESYPAFTTGLNGFTMYDGDGGFPAGFRDMDMPVAGTPQAYWTMTDEDPWGFMSTIGKSSLVTMATVGSNGRPIANDDWLISPELYGGRQTISFYACAQSIDYGLETFEVWASSTGTEISSFRKVLHETEAGFEWERYFVTLPAGTKYFAIRCTSNDRMVFTLDEIRYIAKGTPRPLELQGYNVYRNGVKQNKDMLPAGTTKFTTSRDLEGDDYFVTAVYDKGESTASNIVHFGKVGIGEVEAETAPAEYFDLRGLRVDACALTPGIYIRRCGADVRKVVVR